MKKLLFGITSLTLGGAERVLVDIANKLCDKYDITIFTIYSGGELEKQLSNKVKLKTLYNKQYSELGKFEKKFIPIRVLLNKRGIYRKYIKGNYDVEIAFLEGPVTRLFSCSNKKTRKIVWIHNDISLVFGKGFKSTIKKKLDEKIYSKYEKIIFVSKDNMRKFKKVYKDIRNKYLEPIKKDIIYNYIEKDTVLKKAEENPPVIFNSNEINLVTVARLVPQKALDRLIRVHKRLIDENMLHQIYVIGDGPEKAKLQKMVKDNNLQDSFHLLGKSENPYPYIKQADYFCLLSHFEGYPMVLEEAKILNKSIIISNTASRENVENYSKSTILENNEEKIFEGLKQIIKKYKKNETQEIEEYYDNKIIIEKIEKIIEK